MMEVSISQEVGLELKRFVFRQVEREGIGRWFYSISWRGFEDELYPVFRDLMYALSTMEEGEEFFLDYDVLEQIADDLIVEAPLDLEKYGIHFAKREDAP